MKHYSFRRLGLPNLGFGLAMDAAHVNHVRCHGAEVDWLEIVAEDVWASADISALKSIRQRTPFVLRCAAKTAFDAGYFDDVRALLDELAIQWVTIDVFDKDATVSALTDDNLSLACKHVAQIQDALGRPIVVKNSHLSAGQILASKFISDLSDYTGCGLSIDINAVYENCMAAGQDVDAVVDALPADRVVQINLSGPTESGRINIDPFGENDHNGIWSLYTKLLHKTGPIPTLLDWGAKAPAYPILVDEVFKTKHAAVGVFDGRDISLLPACQITDGPSPNFAA